MWNGKFNGSYPQFHFVVIWLSVQPASAVSVGTSGSLRRRRSLAAGCVIDVRRRAHVRSPVITFSTLFSRSSVIVYVYANWEREIEIECGCQWSRKSKTGSRGLDLSTSGKMRLIEDRSLGRGALTRDFDASVYRVSRYVTLFNRVSR